MVLVSIIVPVYNAEATILRCVQSIQAQVGSNIELILVDDGSTDGSAALIDALAKQDERIHVIHTENRGVSSARNTGIALAKGDYIGFVDADDWIDAGMYRHLIDMIEQEMADIAICGHYLEYADTESAPLAAKPICLSKRVLASDEAFAAALKTYGFQGFLFNKLFRSTFFSQEGYGIRLDETLHICEDLLCVCQCLSKSQKTVYDPAPFYHYLISDNSASHGTFSLRKTTLIDASRKIADLTQQTAPESAQEAQMLYMTNVAYIYTLALHAGSDFKLSRTDAKRVRKHLMSYIIGKDNLRKYKLLLIGLSISPYAVKVIWRLFRKKTKI